VNKKTVGKKRGSGLPLGRTKKDPEVTEARLEFIRDGVLGTPSAMLEGQTHPVPEEVTTPPSAMLEGQTHPVWNGWTAD